MDYVNQFLQLKCAGDVMNVVTPLGNKTNKEICESMSAIKYLKRIALKEPMKYDLYDFCAGNALTSVLAVHLLPIRNAFAIDKRERRRHWWKAKRFSYYNMTIDEFTIHPSSSIILAVHPCKTATAIVDKYNNSTYAEHLILMPCCEGQFKSLIPGDLQKKFGKYYDWCISILNRCDGKFKRLYIDKDNISPRNVIIVASKNTRIK